MKIHALPALLVLSLSAVAAEKEIQLADGRVLRGEVVGEQDGQMLLAFKVGQVSANVRIDPKDVLSVKDAAAVQVPVAAVGQAAQAAPAAPLNEGDFARVRRLLALASRESVGEDATGAGSGLYDGYPYPTWQHWPWLFTIAPRRSSWYGWCGGYSNPHCSD
jgi:hypothetical protein